MYISVCSFLQLSASPSWLQSPQEDLHPWSLACPLSFNKKWGTEWIKCTQFHALEKEMATHSSVLTWRIPGTGEPGGLQSMGSHRVGHDWSDSVAAAAAVSPKCSQIFFKQMMMLGKIEGGRRRGDRGEMVGWHHKISGCESEQTPGDGEGQGSLAGCRPWGHRVGHDWATERQQWCQKPPASLWLDSIPSPTPSNFLFPLCCVSFLWGSSTPPLRKVKWKSLSRVQLFVTPLCDYIVHGILQARILEWVAFPFSTGSSQPRDR